MLSNNNITLRPLKNGDEKLFYLWRNDIEFIKNTKSFRLPKHQGLEKKWLHENMSDMSNVNIIFIISHNNKSLGFIQLTGIDWISRNANFGIAICDKSYRRKGIAKTSMKLLFDYAFLKLDFHKISLEVTAFNKSSIALYELFGFEKEGELKEHYYWDNRYHNIHIYGLLKKNYNYT